MSNLHELAAVALPTTIARDKTVALDATVPSPQQQTLPNPINSTTIKQVRSFSNNQIILFRMDGQILLIAESLSNYKGAKNLAYNYYRQGYKVRVIVEGIEVIRLMNWLQKKIVFD